MVLNDVGAEMGGTVHPRATRKRSKVGFCLVGSGGGGFVRGFLCGWVGGTRYLRDRTAAREEPPSRRWERRQTRPRTAPSDPRGAGRGDRGLIPYGWWKGGRGAAGSAPGFA